MILDPEAISYFIRMGVNRLTKLLDMGDQSLTRGMAAMIGDVLAQPAPQRFDGHKVGAVGGQPNQVDVQLGGPLAHFNTAVIGGAVPDQFRGRSD